jgi:hypothetical protein
MIARFICHANGELLELALQAPILAAPTFMLTVAYAIALNSIRHPHFNFLACALPLV